MVTLAPKQPVSRTVVFYLICSRSNSVTNSEFRYIPVFGQLLLTLEGGVLLQNLSSPCLPRMVSLNVNYVVCTLYLLRTPYLWYEVLCVISWPVTSADSPSQNVSIVPSSDFRIRGGLMML